MKIFPISLTAVLRVTTLLFSLIVSGQQYTVELKKNAIISFIATHFHSPESQQNASEYFDRVFPLAQKYTFKQLVRFNTIDVRTNHFMASSFGLYSWDDKARFDDFHTEPDWPALKATRPRYWQSLRSVHLLNKSDLTIELDSRKVYRITYIWLHDFDNSAETLQKYLDPMREVIYRLGGRYVLNFNETEIFGMSALNNDRKPDRIAITEWPDSDTHKEYIASPEFQKFSHHFFESVAEFEAFDTVLATN